MILQPIDKQSLLDSGILCCMIHILSVLLSANDGKVKQKATTVESLSTSENSDGSELPVRRLEVAFLIACPLLLSYTIIWKHSFAYM